MALLAAAATRQLRFAPRHARRLAVKATADDTIYALSSGRGVAGVAVVRVSGPGAAGALAALAPAKSMPTPRVAALRSLKSPATGEVLDEALVLRFEAPKSFTGEDVVEIHCHGSAGPSGDQIYSSRVFIFKRIRFDAAKIS